MNEIIRVTKIWLHEIFNILDKNTQDDKEWDEFIEKLYNQKRQREGLELYIEKNGGRGMNNIYPNHVEKSQENDPIFDFYTI